MHFYFKALSSELYAFYRANTDTQLYIDPQLAFDASFLKQLNSSGISYVTVARALVNFVLKYGFRGFGNSKRNVDPNTRGFNKVYSSRS